MAEIHVEKKKSIWPWIIAALIAALVLWAPWRAAAVPTPVRLLANIGAAGTLPSDAGAAAILSPDGATLAYSADSGPSAALVELATGADLFVCEATLERGELDGDLRGHLDPDEAVATFRESGAERLLLTHRPSELPLRNGLERAYDGMEIVIERAARRADSVA